MDESLDVEYFNWLYSTVCDISEHFSHLQFFNLLNKLHQTQFVFLISGDDNRAEDGRDLRTEFLREKFLQDDGSLPSEGCSVLEMLIALSRRASFETDDSPHDWFWEFLSNLGLSSMNDKVRFDEQNVQMILDRFIFRTYDCKGNGGLFPMENTQTDQREVEIWYQFNEYLFEMGL